VVLQVVVVVVGGEAVVAKPADVHRASAHGDLNARGRESNRERVVLYPAKEYPDHRPPDSDDLKKKTKKIPSVTF
jgi:hypothetical protein